MNSEFSNEVEVNVKTQYQVVYSNPLKDIFIFSYNISITNHRSTTIQLLRRRWQIFDNEIFIQEVEGAGVIGLQPVLKPQTSHNYESGCQIATPKGLMSGEYLFRDLEKNYNFHVKIPKFILEVPKIFLN